MVDEIAGTLANGYRFRVTPYQVEAIAADGTASWQADTNDLVAVGREGLTVYLSDRTGQTISLTTTSLDDAGRIEDLLRRKLQRLTITPTPTRPSPFSAAERVIILIGGVVAIVIGGYYFITQYL